MDPRYRSSIDQAISRYVKLLNLRSNKLLRSAKAKHLLRELRQLLYAYLGVVLPEKLNEVVPMMSLAQLASNKQHEKTEFNVFLQKVETLLHTTEIDHTDEQLEKVKSRVLKMLHIYHKSALHQDGTVTSNITNIVL